MDVVVLMFAAFRGSRLITEDEIFERLRVWEKLPEGNFFRELLSCVWCVSIWLAAAMLAIRYLWPPIIWLYLALAMSAAAGLLTALEDKLGED